jgi:hypothetical protein
MQRDGGGRAERKTESARIADGWVDDRDVGGAAFH